MRSRSPRLNAFSASSDPVDAWLIGVSVLSIEASDSPSFPRMALVALPRLDSTASLLVASTCSRASTSPVRQPSAVSVTT